MMKNIINICLSSDNNYSQYAGVVIASVLLNLNNDDYVKFYILDGGIDDNNKEKILSLKNIKQCEINFVPIDEKLFESYKTIGTHAYISLSTYYRLKLASLLPFIDKILYLDCDIIVKENISELFNTDIEDFYAAGVVDTAMKSSGWVPKLENDNKYFNAGVLLFNLAKIRQDNIEQKFEEYTKKEFENIKVGDQQILNVVCQGKIKEINSEWNVQSSNFVNRSDYTNTPKIVHYIGKQKPWIFGSMNFWKNLYFKVLQKTTWKIPDNEIVKWTILNQIVSVFNYIKYRPLVLFRPRFYKALYYTYIKKYLDKLLSVQEYDKTHIKITIMGIKIKFPKPEYAKKKSKCSYYYYKKNKTDITKLPKASGQLRNIQLGNLSILLKFDKVCRENNLKYWLWAGSVLGAVRHKGFIPWDDDIDVIMPRNDYNKLIKIFNSYNFENLYAELSDEKIDCMSFLTKIRHKNTHHLCIDVFSCDFCGKNYDKTTQFIETKKILSERNILKKQISDLQKTARLNKIEELINKYSDNTNESGDILMGLEWGHTEKNWFVSNNGVFPLKEIEFEGYKFFSMADEKEYLSDYYGKYMEYPKRITMGHSMFIDLSEKDKKAIEEEIKDLKN
ncbi:MAG: glycosyltransferase [Candidatus Gastranaerophilaceae bacterium]